MSTYNGENVFELDILTPTESNTPPSEINNSDREIKRVIKNQYAVVTKTGSYTLTKQDFCCLCLNTIDITLPTLGDVSDSEYVKMYLIRNSGTGVITIKGTVDGITDRKLYPGQTILIYGSGGNWRRLKQPFNGAKVYRATDQSIPNDTDTMVSWDSEYYDYCGFHESVTNPSRLTVPAGVTRVRVLALGLWDGAANGYRKLAIHKNGVAAWDGRGKSLIAGGTSSYGYAHNVTTGVIEVTENDYFELCVRHDTGGALNFKGGSTNGWFALEVIE